MATVTSITTTLQAIGDAQMRKYIQAVLMLSFVGVVGRASYLLWLAPHVSPNAPCSDAIGAFMVLHPECARIHYTKTQGLHAVCVGGNYLLTDMIGMSADRHTVSSLLFTNARTLQQGVCDCEKPEGLACEVLP